jgi:hypothetical protein
VIGELILAEISCLCIDDTSVRLDRGHLRNAAHHYRNLVQVEEVVNRGSQVRPAHDIYDGSDGIEGLEGVRGLLGDVLLDVLFVLLHLAVVPLELASSPRNLVLRQLPSLLQNILAPSVETSSSLMSLLTTVKTTSCFENKAFT